MVTEQLYQCVGKESGGSYRVICLSKGAGVLRDAGLFTTYQSVQDGELYTRRMDDFNLRMVAVSHSP